MTLRLIGYWRDDQHPEYPDPHDMVDTSWDGDDRVDVVGYLKSGTHLRRFMGLSPCRFCGRHNGASEYTDGVLVWSEALSHYVEDQREAERDGQQEPSGRSVHVICLSEIAALRSSADVHMHAARSRHCAPRPRDERGPREQHGEHAAPPTDFLCLVMPTPPGA